MYQRLSDPARMALVSVVSFVAILATAKFLGLGGILLLTMLGFAAALYSVWRNERKSGSRQSFLDSEVGRMAVVSVTAFILLLSVAKFAGLGGILILTAVGFSGALFSVWRSERGASLH